MQRKSKNSGDKKDRRKAELLGEVTRKGRIGRTGEESRKIVRFS